MLRRLALFRYVPDLTETERQLVPANLTKQRRDVVFTQDKNDTVLLPKLWKTNIPARDQDWVSKALFHASKTGVAELNTELQLWYEAPRPPLKFSRAPSPDAFFMCRKLICWMPLRMFKVQLHCPYPCNGELGCRGVHRYPRYVVDVEESYLMASERIVCKKCGRELSGYDNLILKQLDIGTRSLFPVIVTSRYACDMKVVRMLRERTLGNSSTKLSKTICEQHCEKWLERSVQYFTICKRFCDTPLLKVKFDPPPQPPILPETRWIQSVYLKDILDRLDDVKAALTCVYGSILKLDSTKKITKKIAGKFKDTARWATTISNGIGEILITVLTAAEGHGLDTMVNGVINRYANANVDPPKLLYVDRYCCTGETKSLFAGWPDLIVRLDIFHFMFRLARCVTTTTHVLFGIFMSRLADCIFELDPEDFSRLKNAKCLEMKKEGLKPTDRQVAARIGKKEIKRHCRRTTRGVEKTTTLIAALLEEFSGDKGKDIRGLRLLPSKIWKIWETEKRHVACLQDPIGVPLYRKTGSLIKAGVELPVYRCARGSSSLESFHLHLNRFVPGTTANAVNFQAYLLEGIYRWNVDRQQTESPDSFRCYRGKLMHAANKLSQQVLGKPHIEHFIAPGKYTGERIGIEYLLAQTGKAMPDMDKDELVELDDEEEDVHEQSFDEIENDITIQDWRALTAEDTDDETFADSETLQSKGGQVMKPLVENETLQSKSGQVMKRLVKNETLQSKGGQVVKSLVENETLQSKSGQVMKPFVENETLQSKSGQVMKPLAENETLQSRSAQSVCAENIPGYDKVDQLSTYLCTFRNEDRLYMRNNEVDLIVNLWEQLHDYDKQKVNYEPRHEKPRKAGAFQRRIRTASDLESFERQLIGQRGTAATWPNCNRVVEAIFTKLCNFILTVQHEWDGWQSRWTAILRQYTNIRRLVLGNAEVMDRTTLQLAQVNQKTLIEWYRKNEKKMQQKVLMQGMNLPEHLPLSSKVIPVAIPSTSSCRLPPPAYTPHEYSLPQDTWGHAKTETRLEKTRKAKPTHTVSKPPPPRGETLSLKPKNLATQTVSKASPPKARQNTTLGQTTQYSVLQPTIQSSHKPVILATQTVPKLPPPEARQNTTPGQSTQYLVLQSSIQSTYEPAHTPQYQYVWSQQPSIPSFPLTPYESRTTKWGRDNRGSDSNKRPYKRKKEYNICSTCGEPQNKSTGHSQYRGKVYCPETEVINKTDWIKRMRELYGVPKK